MCRTKSNSDNSFVGGWKSWFMNGRAQPGQPYCPTEGEHIANMITHGIWVLPSMAAILWMTHLASGWLQHVIVLLYGLSLFALFTVSTTYHCLAYTGQSLKRQRDLFHFGDRAVIYVFIAASYTPWLTLKESHSSATSSMLFIVWLAAALGILYQYRFREKYKWLDTVFYLVLGVAPAIVVIEMKESSGLHEMALGGIIYIAGVFFFKCDGVIPFAHAIWHCFVFAGAVLHYNAVCKYLLGDDKLTQIAT